jgi:hypothetical protein
MNDLNRTKIINLLIEKINAKSYLEIGIASGGNFNQINCDYKVSVDPNPNSPATHNITSDLFFSDNSRWLAEGFGYFDVIFVDGLHEAHQVEKDILNSLKHLSPGGFIVCHDMNPEKKEFQIVPRVSNTWTGDCWKAWVKIRSTNPDLNMYVVNTDYGCGVIQKGSQDLLDLNGLELTYENFSNNREVWLNLISSEYFYKRCI